MCLRKGKKTCLFGPKGKLDNCQLWRCIYFFTFSLFFLWSHDSLIPYGGSSGTWSVMITRTQVQSLDENYIDLAFRLLNIETMLLFSNAAIKPSDSIWRNWANHYNISYLWSETKYLKKIWLNEVANDFWDIEPNYEI